MILLDTCTLLWLVSGHERLSARARTAVSLNRASLAISAISAFEIGLKNRKGLMKLPESVETWWPAILQEHGLTEIAINGGIAARSAILPPHHADPADRMIVATAQVHSLTILTPDPHIACYDIKTLW